MTRDRRSNNRDSFLYEDVAAKIERMVQQGAYRPGERIPSIRDLSNQMRVSINTVMEAYARLESMNVIEARPQSGYYVRRHLPEPEACSNVRLIRDSLSAKVVRISDTTMRLVQGASGSSILPLGISAPNPALLPIDKLSATLSAQVRKFRSESIAFKEQSGLKRLREQIARRAFESGCTLSPDEIIVTSGCMEAVTLALQAICRRGDTIAVASPVYYSFLSTAQWLDLKVIEIPSAPREGLSLEALSYAIKHNSIKGCMIISNFNNPLGSLMPEEKKRDLVRLLERHNIPLIEDDVSGDLTFGASRPVTAKSFDRKGQVLLCSSFSKTLAPGYRVGWIAPGRFLKRIEELRSYSNMIAAAPSQFAIAEFLENGWYDRHLKNIRRTYSRQLTQLRNAVGRYFPTGTRATKPEGGFLLWVELPEQVDTQKLYERALQIGVSLASGVIFTNGDRFRNCIRLNATYWSEHAEKAMELLGKLACEADLSGCRTSYRRSPGPPPGKSVY